MTVKNINAKLTAAGKPVEIERGDGYIYFIYDVPADNVYETYSVMTPYLNAYTDKEWIEQGLAFAEAMENGTYDARTGQIKEA